MPARPSRSAARAWFTSRQARALGWALVVLGLVATGIVAVSRQVRDGNDFPIYWQAARDLLADRSPYDVGSGLHGYVYLPWFALLLMPLALLPLPAAAAVWYGANLACVWLAGRTLVRVLRRAGLAPHARWLALAALPLAGLFHDNLVLGQANLLLLLLLSAGVAGALRARPGGSAGIPLGLAAALKMPAALLLLPLLRRGRARSAAGSAAALLLAVALPFLTTGIPLGRQLLLEWRAKVVAPALAGRLQGSKVIDQSPHAALRRLLVNEPAYAGRRVNLAALGPVAFAAVSRAMAATILLAYLLLWAFAPAPARPLALLLDLALGCCALVQVVGFNLKAQFVVLLLPAWLGVTLAASRPDRAPRALLLVWGAAFLLSQPGLVGRAFANVMLAGSSMTVGTFCLTVSLALQRVRDARPAAVEVAEPAA